MPVQLTKLHAGLTSVLLTALLGCGALGAGCKARVEGAGKEREVEASYRFRSLSADLTDGVSVRAAAAAGESALRSRGYIVTRSDTTSDHARIEAKSHGSGALSKVVFEARAIGGGSRVSVTSEPFGNESVSRSLLDATLARLGR